ncbi:stage II sporulation protein M [Lachnospiraceae bacterium ZAX-1]
MKHISKNYLRMKMGRKPEKSAGGMKYIRLLFLGCFIVGIICANLLGKEKLDSFGILNEYFIEKFKYTTIRQESLFYYILEARLPIMALLLLLVFTVFGIVFGMLFIGWQGFAAGFLISVALIKYGLKGLLLVGGAAFPQYIIYIPVYMIYLHLAVFTQKKIAASKEEGGSGRPKAYVACFIAVVLILGAYIIGIFLESYVNPPLLKGILKIF